MNLLLQNLLKLQSLEFGKTSGKEAPPLVAELRGKIPEPVLAHYDRLMIRGKKGIVLVQNQVCTGCHMCVPIGAINTLMSGQDIQLCESCGRYLCLPEKSAATPAVPESKPAKAVKKTRKPKPVLQAV